MARKRKGKGKHSRKKRSRRRSTHHKASKHTRKRSKHSFPKNPSKGDTKTITVRGRKVTFVATGKKGFGAWRIKSNG